MKKILLFGKDGQVGQQLISALAPIGEIIAAGRREADLSNPDAIQKLIHQVKPNIVVNAAAYTNVDGAETNQDLAFKVNAAAPEIMAKTCQEIEAQFVHYSTDYVFDGKGNSPLSEDDPTNPLSVYGESKLAGEKAVRSVAPEAGFLILRTSWVYGKSGSNFMNTILRVAGQHKELRVVDDQFGAPTTSRFIAQMTAKMLIQSEKVTENPGIYHLSAGGQTTWYQFANSIIEKAKQTENHALVVEKIIPITTEEWPLPAERPKFSVLNHDKLKQVFGLNCPDWKVLFDQVSS